MGLACGLATQPDPEVDRVLRTFAVVARKSTRWARRVADLRRVLGADYATAVARFVAAGELPIEQMQRRVGVLFPDFNSNPMRFEDLVNGVADSRQGLGVRVRLSPYGSVGHPLLYHRQPDHRAMIWLSMRHTPTAMAATLAHEVGHVFREDLRRETSSDARLLYNADFAGHLRDPRELFADAFATMAAYPREIARALFTRKGRSRGLARVRDMEQEVVANVHDYLRRQYGAELGPASGLPLTRRFYYITSMIHFAKVRAAILKTVGL